MNAQHLSLNYFIISLCSRLCVEWHELLFWYNQNIILLLNYHKFASNKLFTLIISNWYLTMCLGNTCDEKYREIWPNHTYLFNMKLQSLCEYDPINCKIWKCVNLDYQFYLSFCSYVNNSRNYLDLYSYLDQEFR